MPMEAQPSTTQAVGDPQPQPMSAEVSLISNPIPSFSVYQWMPRGVRNLNRRNKLSSLPFWFPNDKMRQHQFRLVLLRGVVRGEEEDDDPVAVFLEYLPPPSGGAPGDVAPKGCRVTMRLANRLYINEGDRSFDVVAECTASIDGEDRQVAFREFIGANVLRNAAFVGDDGSTMILEVSILTGVNVVADTVVKSAGSLWSTFSSLSTSVSTFVKKTVQSVQDQRDEIREGDGGNRTLQSAAGPSVGSAANSGAAGVNDLQTFFGHIQSMVGGATRSGTTTPQEPSNAGGRELPWEAVPERWVGREGAWKQLLTHTLVEDENTFLIGAKRGITSEEQMLMTQFGLNHRAITAADSLFDYDRDVHEGLLSLQQLRAQRYRLVPQKMSDVAFWTNFMWKVASLSTCGSDEQAQLLLSIINSPQRITTAARGGADAGSQSSTSGGTTFASLMRLAVDGLSSIGGGKPLDEAEVVHAVQEALEATATLEELLRDLADHNGDTSQCGAGAAADASDEVMFIAAAWSSCDRHKDVLERLLRRQGTPELHESLTAALAALSEQLSKAAARLDAPGTVAPRSPPCSTVAPLVLPDDARIAEAVDGRSPVRSVADDASAPRTPDDNGGQESSESEGPQQHADDVAAPLGADDAADSPCVDAREDRSCPSPPAEAPQASNVSAVEERPCAPAPPPPQVPVRDEDDSFERLPSIDDMATPTCGNTRRSNSQGGFSSSSKALAFAPMPWEEDDDA